MQRLQMQNKELKVQGITRDNVSVNVSINILFRVKNDDQSIIDSVYKNDNILQTIDAMIEEQLRATLYGFTHEEVFAKRDEIGTEIREILESKLTFFGMELDSVQVRDINLDSRVMSAMNDVVSAEKEKIAMVSRAEGEKAQMILSAEGEKEIKKLLGEGMAAQREAIAHGFKNSVHMIQEADKTLTAKDVLQFLLDSSRIETLQKVGESNAKVIYVNENLEGKQASLIQN